MALSTEDRRRTWAQFMRDILFPGDVLKTDLSAALGAVDDWCDANAVSFNQALPLPFRTSANASQKALLLAYVCMRRAGVLKTREDSP